MDFEKDSGLLKTSLEVAVPMWAERFRAHGKAWWEEWIDTRREEVMYMIASHGDNILFRAKKAGETAKAFNALAEGLAAMSFVPGGVKFLGITWESTFSGE